MTDLSVQEFKDLSSTKLEQIFLNEQTKMFGEQESHLNREGNSRLFLSSLARLIIKIIKSKGGRKCYKMKS
jgi:hypothetical protein